MNSFVNGAMHIMTEEEREEFLRATAPSPIDVIDELKQKLADTDYKTLKYVEGALSDEEFLAACAERALWRSSINELEENNGL